MNIRQAVIDLGFRTLGMTGVPKLAVPYTRGLGAILMLHHVRPWHGGVYAPNRELEITPEFFDAVLQHLRVSGWIIVTMDEALERIAIGKTDRPFAVLTFDDGYRDTLEWALPIMQREKAPGTLYITQGFVERTASMWWLDIEDAIRKLDHVEVRVRGMPSSIETRTGREKNNAAAGILRSLRNAPQHVIEAVRSKLVQAAGVNGLDRVDALCMDRRDLVDAAGHPLITIAAHTRTHPMLASLPENDARAEMAAPKAWLETHHRCAGAAFRLSGRQAQCGGSARVPSGPRIGICLWRDDKAGHGVFRSRGPFPCFAAPVAEWPLSVAERGGNAAIRPAIRLVECISPRQRQARAPAHSSPGARFSIQRIMGKSGKTQPSPATI